MESPLRPYPPPSLVAYGPPICISTDASAIDNHEGLLAKAGAAQVDPACGQRTVDILDELLPPRIWSQSDNTLWWQRCDTQTPAREDVLRLEERLNQQLRDRRACPKPLCSIREELFPQAFDELIRQVALLTPEAGVLLTRIRDELRMNLSAYRTVYDTFQLGGESIAEVDPKEEAVLAEEVKQLEARVSSLKDQIHELNHINTVTAFAVGLPPSFTRPWLLQGLEKRGEEERTARQAKYAEEIEFLEGQGAEIQRFLDALAQRDSEEIE